MSAPLEGVSVRLLKLHNISIVGEMTAGKVKVFEHISARSAFLRLQSNSSYNYSSTRPFSLTTVPVLVEESMY